MTLLLPTHGAAHHFLKRTFISHFPTWILPFSPPQQCFPTSVWVTARARWPAEAQVSGQLLGRAFSDLGGHPLCSAVTPWHVAAVATARWDFLRPSEL